MATLRTVAIGLTRFCLARRGALRAELTVETAADILHAAQKVRDAGFRRWDVFTPFPVHGMDRAMGLKNSKVGWFAFIGGVTGYTTGMLMIWYMNALDYPLVVGATLVYTAILVCANLTVDVLYAAVDPRMRTR